MTQLLLPFPEHTYKYGDPVDTPRGKGMIGHFSTHYNRWCVYVWVANEQHHSWVYFDAKNIKPLN